MVRHSTNKPGNPNKYTWRQKKALPSNFRSLQQYTLTVFQFCRPETPPSGPTLDQGVGRAAFLPGGLRVESGFAPLPAPTGWPPPHRRPQQRAGAPVLLFVFSAAEDGSAPTEGGSAVDTPGYSNLPQPTSRSPPFTLSAKPLLSCAVRSRVLGIRGWASPGGPRSAEPGPPYRGMPAGGVHHAS